MKRGAMIAFAGATLAGAGVVGLWAWWNQDASVGKLEALALTWPGFMVEDTTGLSSEDGMVASRVLARLPSDGQTTRVRLTAEIRRREINWPLTSESVPATGTRSVEAIYYAAMMPGSLQARPPVRPSWDSRGAAWDIPEDEAGRLWARLESEPANAAFDALVFNRWSDITGEPPIIFLSALRRLNKLKAAVDLATSEEMNISRHHLDAKWRTRFWEEIRMIKPLVQSESDRRRLSEVLSDRDVDDLY